MHVGLILPCVTLPAKFCSIAVLNMPRNDFLMLKYDKRKIQPVLNTPSDNASERVVIKQGRLLPCIQYRNLYLRIADSVVDPSVTADSFIHRHRVIPTGFHMNQEQHVNHSLNNSTIYFFLKSSWNWMEWKICYQWQKDQNNIMKKFVMVL